ncbi:MAG: DNA gyrase/topoisomerase IV subunit A, partial [Paludibacteraceae bacterium]|nr:DNA gyrase/topoisomerase IV subunit A [Paludibacteraceae bacterium]
VRNFGAINVKAVVENNEKLYINRAEGFVGTSLKKDEYLFDCSDIDDIIVFHRDGKYKIMKVADKIFVGTDILHIAVFQRGDDRTIYNVVYRDGKKGTYFMKRFSVTGVAKDKEYDLTQGKPGSRVVYFTANPNGEAEIIRVSLKPALHLKKLEVCKDLSELAVKSRTARGNVLTKFDVKSITLKQKGHSTLGGRKVWFDADVLRVNYDEHGVYLGEFWDEDRILVITKEGDYYTTSFDLTAHFEDNILRIEKLDADKVWSLIQWNGEQNYFYGKRFRLDDANAKVQSMLGDDRSSRIVVLSDRPEATFRITFMDEKRDPLDILMADFIDEKSARAKGKRVTTLDVASIEDITPEPGASPQSNGESGLRIEGQEDDFEEEPFDDEEPDTQESPETPDTPEAIDVEGVTMTFEKPVDTQLDLF